MGLWGQLGSSQTGLKINIRLTIVSDDVGHRSSDAARLLYPHNRRHREGRRDIAGPLFAPPVRFALPCGRNEGSRPLTGPFDLARGGGLARGHREPLHYPATCPATRRGAVERKSGV